MNQKIFLPVAIGTIIISSVLQSNLSVFRQYGNVSQKERATVDPNITCVQRALQLLNQTKREYVKSNYSAADDNIMNDNKG